jgi:hypothetical protein
MFITSTSRSQTFFPHFLSCTLVILLWAIASTTAFAVTLEKRVSSANDDAEELESGSVSLSSSDLELVFDRGNNQVVGIRFSDLDIPDGAQIERAYIQFDVDETNTVATFLTIQGEASDSAETFSSSHFNVSSRTPTSAFVYWEPPAWNTVHAQGPAQQTPDLSAIVQEIVERPGWNPGNALVFTITGSGERTAESYNGTAAAAPLLHVEYSTGPLSNQPPAVDAGQNQTISLPAVGVSLNDASVDDDGLPVGGTLTQNWSQVGGTGTGTVMFVNPGSVNTDINLPQSPGTYILQLTASDGNLEASDTVTITVLPESTGATILERRVSAGFDDAEEGANGSVSLTSSDLELVFDRGNNQVVGIRFSDLDIPGGAQIERAYIQFDVDEANTEATFLTIQGEASDSAAAFSSNPYDVSSRVPTSAFAYWEPSAWNTVHAQGPVQQTTDLSAVVQEIVARPGWNRGNALAFIITGSGERTAESYDGTAAAAPLLHIEYSGGNPDTAFGSWADLNISLNGLDVGTDTANRRLLAPLGAGFGAPNNLTATVTYDLADQGYTLGFDNGLMVASGGTVQLSNIVYGTTIPVQLFQDGVPVEVYSLVFTNLPVIELNADTIVDEPKSPGFFSMVTGERLASGDFFPASSAWPVQNTGVKNMGIEFRGSTSQQYPKKSFSLEVRKDDDPTDEQNLVLLDMRKDGDWLLDATYRDTAFVRNIISLEIYNDMRPYAYIDDLGEQQGQAAIRGQQVEVILNESYHGAYILEEKLDRKLLGLDKVDVPEDALGNELWDQVDFSNPDNGSVLYKADTNNASLYFPLDVSSDFEQKYPDIDDIAHWGPLEELADFVANSSDAEFISRVDSIVDIDSVVDYWLLTNITMNRDTLKKNYYLARNKSAKWFFVPWDYDATFGMLWDGSPYTTVSWWDPQKNNLVRRLAELTATGFNARAKSRWLELRASLFTEDAIMDRFIAYRQDAVPVALETENARSRNFARWPESGGEGVNNPELGTLEYIRDWLRGRIAFLDEEIMAQPE